VASCVIAVYGIPAGMVFDADAARGTRTILGTMAASSIVGLLAYFCLWRGAGRALNRAKPPPARGLGLFGDLIGLRLDAGG
jgi:hypothetical protein